MENWAKIIIGDSRSMMEIEDESVHLIVTSPPYWHIKDYGVASQIGHGQNLHEYLKDLYRVWRECFRVLKPGRRLVINIGDQFTRTAEYGRYKIIPLHAEIIVQCEQIGFDYMGSIIWQKRTTMNTSGGATVMGSYPYPPNGMVEIDHEYILIFKKLGKSEKVEKHVKEASKLTKEEWKEYFRGHWRFGGARQVGHEAMFPEELPYRIIRMFSFVGETVLDPFLGSGTTIKVALDNFRNGIGYEINEEFLELIRRKIGKNLLRYHQRVEIIRRNKEITLTDVSEYVPMIKDGAPIKDKKKKKTRSMEYPLHKVTEILENGFLKLDCGKIIKFLGVEITDHDGLKQYLNRYLRKKKIFLKFDRNHVPIEEQNDEKNVIEAYVYLKNKIFINAEIIKLGYGVAVLNGEYDMKDKFLGLHHRRTKQE